MRIIETATVFKRDYKRESKGRYGKTKVVHNLIGDAPLDAKYKNHPLIGDWAGYWECHIKPDLLLIYKKVDTDKLFLARIGSHSELFK